MFNPVISPHIAGGYYLEALQVAGERLAVNQQTVPVRDPNEIERSIQAFAQDTGGGLIVLPDTFTLVHRDLIVAATAKYRLPSIYSFRLFAAAGGFLSYGINSMD